MMELLFGGKKFYLNRVRYLMGVKSDITCLFSHDCAKTKVDLYDSLPLEKTLIFQNHYYYKKEKISWSIT